MLQVADSWVAKWSGDAAIAAKTVAIVLAIGTDSIDIARRSLAAVAEYLQWRGSQDLPLDREGLWVEAELEAFREECHPSARASELIERARRADLGVPGRRTVHFPSIRTVELQDSDREQFVRALGRLVHSMHSKHVDDGKPAEAA